MRQGQGMMRARWDGQLGGLGEERPRAVVDEAGPDREGLVHYAVHGLLYEAIAEVAGRAVGLAKSRMSHAHAALKRMLLGDEREDAPPADRGDRPRAHGGTAAVGASVARRGEGNRGRG